MQKSTSLTEIKVLSYNTQTAGRVKALCVSYNIHHRNSTCFGSRESHLFLPLGHGPERVEFPKPFQVLRPCSYCIGSFVANFQNQGRQRIYQKRVFRP